LEVLHSALLAFRSDGAQAFQLTHKPIRGRRQMAMVALFGGSVPQGFHLLAQAVHVLCMLLNHSILLSEQHLLLDEFISLRSLFSQDFLLFSHSEQFFFDRHALTLLALLLFGKSPADLICYRKS
jgi:hypothetical protein